jgi:hypothetical protein
MAVSLLAPVLYIAFLFGPLYVFSKYYMRARSLWLEIASETFA